MVESYRLPTDVRPKHYDLTIRTDLQTTTFSGAVSIDIDVVRSTRLITLHAAAELQIADVSLALESGEQLVPVETIRQDTAQRMVLRFADVLAQDAQATLQIAFSGALQESSFGFYKCVWKRGVYAVTQFAPTDARRAIPCWDEPSLKATFSLTLVAQPGLFCLSNMPVSAELVSSRRAKNLLSGVNAGVWAATTFETTPPMSTYLLAFAVGDFAFLESSYRSPISGRVRPLRVYTTPDVITQGQWILDVTAKVVPLYEKAFNIEFPLPKLDALCVDMGDAGAVENWGLIVGATSVYLVDPKRTDLVAKKRAAKTHIHEVAHMWFGDITTTAWWDMVYLNEGTFSEMGQNFILERAFPEWAPDLEFTDSELQPALQLDAKRSSHPIELDSPDPGQIKQYFDRLAYGKAASVLRMLAGFVGLENFLRGVSLYLKRHIYSNAVSDDLWAAVGDVTELDGKGKHEWPPDHTNVGFPILTVTETPTSIIVRQDRFLGDGPASPEDNQTIWYIPLGLRTTSTAEQAVSESHLLLNIREREFELDTSKPFKLNSDSQGVYRVLHTPQRLSQIIQEAARSGSAFSSGDRLGLVHDAFALGKAGYQLLSIGLDVVTTLRSEEKVFVWNGIQASLTDIAGTWWEDKYINNLLDVFRRDLFVPLVKRLGFEYSSGEDPETTQLRTLAIVQAAEANDGATIQFLRKAAAEYIGGRENAIPTDLLSIAFRTAVRHGGKAEYDAMVKIVEDPATPSLMIAAAQAMTASADRGLQKQTFDFILNKAPTQGILVYFKGFAADFQGRRSQRAFFERNYSALYARLGALFTFQYIIETIYSCFSDEADHASIQAFFGDKDTDTFSQALSQALEGISSRAAIVERSTTDIAQWLEMHDRR
ncbi:leucyl aminopeptidase [Gloeopeniophorella convolvens]|nr:leucyl aminopeptidase [Gloeopeniophorella convolvens]